jgi:capsular polysaccharide biosynthesis protein
LGYGEKATTILDIAAKSAWQPIQEVIEVSGLHAAEKQEQRKAGKELSGVSKRNIIMAMIISNIYGGFLEYYFP